jgi:hyperosmotically inducible protein
MFRALFKLVILLIVLFAVGGFFLGWWGAGVSLPDRDTVATAGETGAERAKRAGQEISQKTADAAKTAQEALSDGTLTAKIKAKMALDDRVKARDLDVDTTNGVVTVTGKLRSTAERERALALARETEGVRQVVDRTTLDTGSR